MRWSDDVALTVVMAARGYPGAVEKGSEIRGLAAAEGLQDVLVFHAGEQNRGTASSPKAGVLAGMAARPHRRGGAGEGLRGGEPDRRPEAFAGVISTGPWRGSAADPGRFHTSGNGSKVDP